MKAVSDYRGIAGSLVRDKIKSDRTEIWMDPECISDADPYDIWLATGTLPDTYTEFAQIRGTFDSH